MHTQSRTVVLLSLICLLMLTPLLSGCGAIGAAKQVAETAKSAATLAAEELAKQPTEEVAEEPTEEPAEEPAEEPTEESSSEEAATELQNTFNNLVQLAPVHMTSSWVTKKDETVESNVSYEADLDAKGNQHLVLKANSDDPVEIYLVDKVMYLKAEGDQFIKMGDIEDDAGFSFLAIYGGAYLLAFNDLKDAKRVGSESVGDFQADKYEINMDLGSLGLGGLAAGAQGAEWDYKGNAWVEPNAKALVKAVVDWRSKDATSGVTETWHSEFLASKGTITEVTAPANIVDMGSVGN